MDAAFASNLNDWLNLFLRWAHVIAGIMWIGNSFYFMWLDASLERPADPDTAKVEGSLWMVHSGGFYQVERRKIAPGEMPKVLHWFKWEATFTWITGFILLGVLYYLTGGLYLLDPARPTLTPSAASWLGIGTLAASWLVYDQLWLRLGTKQPRAAMAISLGLLVALAYGLTQVFSGRAAFIHVGAVMGTIMVANVWVRILPGQHRMINATKEGRKADFTEGKKAKTRSIHNSYMTLPVLFMMLSNHYPMTYSGPRNWIVLALLFVVGAAVRHVMIVGLKKAAWVGTPATLALLALVGLTSPLREETPLASTGEAVSFTQAQHVIAQRCTSCHSPNPTDKTFGAAPPSGVTFDSPEKIRGFAQRIRFRAVETKTMPLGNRTGMTEEERALLGRWIDQGARLQ